jgi:lysophospholipase L1-like esterase
MLFSTTVLAKSENAKESFVALGDSIPFGYNLGETNMQPPKEAFPFQIGKEADLRVRNLAIPGWKTSEMLSALTTDQKFRQAVGHADYVTLNIGNNDLLQALKAAQLETINNPLLFFSTLQAKVLQSNLYGNLTTIVGQIRSLTDAPIVVYNIYNPFQVVDPLHNIGNIILPGINSQFAVLGTQLNSFYGNIIIADAYSAFGTNQARYVIAGDIHPTEEGQKVLAEIGLEALGLEE